MSEVDGAPNVLEAHVSDVRPLASLLRAVSFSKRATVVVSDAGLKITTENARSVQAHAYLHKTIFSSYRYHSPSQPSSTTSESLPNASISPQYDEEPIAFEIHLPSLLECLNIFGGAGPSTGFATAGWREGGDAMGMGRGRGGSRRRDEFDDEDGFRREGMGEGKTTSMSMIYAGEGEPLELVLEEGDATTRCKLTTYQPDELLSFPFDDTRRVQKVIMKSEWLRDALSELDASCSQLTISFNPPSSTSSHAMPRPTSSTAETGTEASQIIGNRRGTKQKRKEKRPLFRITADGDFGSTEMDFPNDRDVLELFECIEPIENSYKFTHISHALKALQQSIKTSIRTDDQGLMSLQFMMPAGTGSAGAGSGLASSAAGNGVSGNAMGREMEAAVKGGHGFVEFLCLPLEDDD